jgi:hypothetical protein
MAQLACAGNAGDPQPFVYPADLRRSFRLIFASIVSFEASIAFGVLHPVGRLTAVRVSATPRDTRAPDDSASSALAVGQPASFTAAPSVNPAPFPLWCFSFSAANRDKWVSMLAVRFITCASGVGHPPQPLSDVRRADAVCAQYNRPAGVAFRFQV